MTQATQKPQLVFLAGKKVNLRPFRKEDVPLVTRWINDPKVREFLATVLPHTEKQEEDWYEKLGSDDHHIVLCIETKDGQPIGIMGIHKINWVHRTCETGALIGEKEYWGKGFGTDAKMHLLEYIFHTLNLKRVGSNVFAFNKRSLNYSLRCGYKIEGRKRKHLFRKGKYWDVIELGLLRKDWEPIWKQFNKKTKEVRHGRRG
jgi:RimJ/RimL family protein N-acetyltransferase